jgi:hypothetical protein
MLRLALLTAGTWTVVSFLFTWVWGTAISLLADRSGCNSVTDRLSLAHISAAESRGELICTRPRLYPRR